MDMRRIMCAELFKRINALIVELRIIQAEIELLLISPDANLYEDKPDITNSKDKQ